MSAADKIAEAKGLMPDRIWLLPCAGDEGETLWCEDPAPGAGMREEDAVAYVRADLADAQAQENARLRSALEQIADSSPWVDAGDDLRDFAKRALKVKP